MTVDDVIIEVAMILARQDTNKKWTSIHEPRRNAYLKLARVIVKVCQRWARRN